MDDCISICVSQAYTPFIFNIHNVESWRWHTTHKLVSKLCGLSIYNLHMMTWKIKKQCADRVLAWECRRNTWKTSLGVRTRQLKNMKTKEILEWDDKMDRNNQKKNTELAFFSFSFNILCVTYVVRPIDAF